MNPVTEQQQRFNNRDIEFEAAAHINSSPVLSNANQASSLYAMCEYESQGSRTSKPCTL